VHINRDEELSMKPSQDIVKVWDPVVRIGHWTLVVAFFVAYFTEDDLMTQHVWAGYVVGAVVCFRLLWGFVGTEHARFKDFVVSPATMLQYVRDLRRKQSKRYIGHNPTGGAMIIALLLCLSITVYTGLALYAIEDHAGPLAAWFAPGPAASAPAGDDEDPREEFWEELHEVFSNITLALVILHVAGGLLSSYIYKENLIGAMITGRKRP
jgi:cytochrome b